MEDITIYLWIYPLILLGIILALAVIGSILSKKYKKIGNIIDKVIDFIEGMLRFS